MQSQYRNRITACRQDLIARHIRKLQNSSSLDTESTLGPVPVKILWVSRWLCCDAAPAGKCRSICRPERNGGGAGHGASSEDPGRGR
jgi:hypothetical protein